MQDDLTAGAGVNDTCAMPDTRLKTLRRKREQLEKQIEAEVERMRQDDQPWSLIADALGVTRQAAQQRYGTTNKEK